MRSIRNLPISELTPEEADAAYIIISGIGDRSAYSDRVSLPVLRTLLGKFGGSGSDDEVLVKVEDALRQISDEKTIRVIANEEMTSRIQGAISTFNTAVSSATALIQDEIITRASATEALTARIQTAESTFKTDISSAVARITTEERTRATANEAMTSRIETAQSTFTTDITAAVARITREETTRATATGALTTRLDTAESNFTTGLGAANARITNEETTRATATDALTSRIISAETNFATDLSQTNARIATEETTRSTADEALTTRIETAESNFSNGLIDANARITTEETTRSNALGALASRTTKLEADFASGTSNSDLAEVNARITNEEEVRANADGAFATRVTDIETRYDNKFVLANARITDEATARSTAIDAVSNRIQTVEASYVTEGRAASIADAKVADEATARSNAVGALASRIQTVEASYVTEGTAASIADAKVADEASARSTAVGALASRIQTVEASYVTEGRAASIADAKVADEASARASAVEAVANRITSVEARSGGGGGGNLITDSTFDTTDGWAFTAGNLPAPTLSAGLNIAGSNYHLENENTLSIYQGGNAGLGFGGYCEWYGSGTDFAVQAGKYMQFYVYYNSHRANTMLYISWMNADGVIFLNSTTVPYGPTDKLGNDLNNYVQIGLPSIRVPDSAVKARMVLRKFDTDPGYADSYAWFVRPYAGIVREGATEWNPYSPGSGRAALIATGARVSSESTARTTADSALGSRIDSIYADYQSLNTNTNARVDSEQSARASGDSALGSRVDTVSASVSGANGGDTLNPRFSVYSTADGNPSDWLDWLREGNYRTTRQSPGIGSQWAIQTLNDTPNVQSGFYQGVKFRPGKWMIEVTMRLDAGDLTGAGVTLSGAYNLDFSSDPDTEGAIDAGLAGRVRTFSKVFDIPPGVVGEMMNLHAMTGWVGFGRPISPKYITWYHVSAKLLNTAETYSYKVDARVTSESTASANRDAALGQRIDTVSASAGSLGATVSSNSTAIANLNGRTAAYWQTTAVAGNNRAQLTIRADANGGAGVDIVGDVSITGDLLVSGTVSSGKLAPSSVQQVAYQTLTYTINVPRG